MPIAALVTRTVELPAVPASPRRPRFLHVVIPPEENSSQAPRTGRLRPPAELGRSLSTSSAERFGVQIVALCEGGPTLNGTLLDDGLVDDHRTTAPQAVVGGAEERNTFDNVA